MYGWALDEKLVPGQRIRQGDLVIFNGETNPLRKAGIVVTADCDLEKKKHGRLVTLVPIVTVDALLENYLLIEACERQKDTIGGYVKRVLKIEGKTDDPVTLAEIRAQISLPETEHEDVLTMAANFLLHNVEKISIAEYKALMKALKVDISQNNKKIEDQIKSKGDLIAIPTPAAFGVEGEIVWVRQLWQIPLGKIVDKNSEVATGIGQRIAHLDSPFKYRVTQVMAQVFSDIGLPDYATGFSADLLKIF